MNEHTQTHAHTLTCTCTHTDLFRSAGVWVCVSVCIHEFIITWVGCALPNFHHFDDILNLFPFLTVFYFNSLSVFFFTSFFYYFLSLFLGPMKTVLKVLVFLIIPCVSSYRLVHFSRAVLFCQPHQQLFTHSLRNRCQGDLLI